MGRTTTTRGKANLHGKERPGPRGGGREATRLGTRRDVTAAVREMRATRHLPQGEPPREKMPQGPRSRRKEGPTERDDRTRGQKLRGKGCQGRCPTPQVELDPVDSVLVGGAADGGRSSAQGEPGQGRGVRF